MGTAVEVAGAGGGTAVARGVVGGVTAVDGTDDGGGTRTRRGAQDGRQALSADPASSLLWAPIPSERSSHAATRSCSSPAPPPASAWPRPSPPPAPATGPSPPCGTPTATAPLRAAADAAGVELDIRPLDVTDEASSRPCVDGVVADHGHLDAVVNNAGAGHIGTIEQVSMATSAAG